MSEATHSMVAALAQLDFDAVAAYERALPAIEAGPDREVLASFQHDHRRHWQALARLIDEQCLAKSEWAVGLKGLFMQGVTSLMSSVGTRPALLALKASEMLSHKAYRQALDATLPPRVRHLIQAHFADEERHLSSLQKTLDELALVGRRISLLDEKSAL